MCRLMVLRAASRPYSEHRRTPAGRGLANTRAVFKRICAHLPRKDEQLEGRVATSGGRGGALTGSALAVIRQAAWKAAISTAADLRATVAAGAVGAS
jgi:hypothetical protein